MQAIRFRILIWKKVDRFFKFKSSIITKLQNIISQYQKYTSNLFLKYVFFADISGTTWAIKSFLHLFASLSKELSDEKRIF